MDNLLSQTFSESSKEGGEAAPAKEVGAKEESETPNEEAPASGSKRSAEEAAVADEKMDGPSPKKDKVDEAVVEEEEDEDKKDNADQLSDEEMEVMTIPIGSSVESLLHCLGVDEALLAQREITASSDWSEIRENILSDPSSHLHFFHNVPRSLVDQLLANLPPNMPPDHEAQLTIYVTNQMLGNALDVYEGDRQAAYDAVYHMLERNFIPRYITRQDFIQRRRVESLLAPSGGVVGHCSHDEIRNHQDNYDGQSASRHFSAMPTRSQRRRGRRTSVSLEHDFEALLQNVVPILVDEFGYEQEEGLFLIDGNVFLPVGSTRVHHLHENERPFHVGTGAGRIFLVAFIVNYQFLKVTQVAPILGNLPYRYMQNSVKTTTETNPEPRLTTVSRGNHLIMANVYHGHGVSADGVQVDHRSGLPWVNPPDEVLPVTTAFNQIAKSSNVHGGVGLIFMPATKKSGPRYRMQKRIGGSFCCVWVSCNQRGQSDETAKDIACTERDIMDLYIVANTRVTVPAFDQEPFVEPAEPDQEPVVAEPIQEPVVVQAAAAEPDQEPVAAEPIQEPVVVQAAAAVELAAAVVAAEPIQEPVVVQAAAIAAPALAAVVLDMPPEGDARRPMSHTFNSVKDYYVYQKDKYGSGANFKRLKRRGGDELVEWNRAWKAQEREFVAQQREIMRSSRRGIFGYLR